jgi:thymidylate kinase
VPPDIQHQCEDVVRGNAWLERYWGRLRKRRLALPMPISFIASKALHFQKLWRDRQLMAVEKPAETVLELVRGAQQKLRLWPQSAMLIALSGPDGSGKTAHARALAQAFSTAAIRNRIVWTRVGATPLIQALRPRLVNGTERRAAQAPQPIDHVFNRHGWRLAVWAMVTSADYAAWLLYVRWQLLRGDVVIADRFLCDFEVELGIRLAGWPGLLDMLRGVVRKVAPVPRTAYLLRIAPEVASRRRLTLGGDDKDDIAPAEQCKHYDALCGRDDLRVIDAALPQDDVSSTIVNDALSIYMEHFSPIGNTFLFSNSWQLNPTVSRPPWKPSRKADMQLEA